MSETPGALGVHKAIVQVAKAISAVGISKDGRNQEQKFNFRGIDQVLNALSPLYAEAGLFITPNVLERTVIEGKTKNGSTLWKITVKVEYRIWSSHDGSSLVCTTYGESMDSADKATNKAMSAAYKYLAIQLFAIPVEGTPDADAEHQEMERGNSRQRGNNASHRFDTTVDLEHAVEDGLEAEAAAYLSRLDPAVSKGLMDPLSDEAYNRITAAWPKR